MVEDEVTSAILKAWPVEVVKLCRAVISSCLNVVQMAWVGGMGRPSFAVDAIALDRLNDTGKDDRVHLVTECVGLRPYRFRCLIADVYQPIDNPLREELRWPAAILGGDHADRADAHADNLVAHQSTSAFRDSMRLSRSACRSCNCFSKASSLAARASRLSACLSSCALISSSACVRLVRSDVTCAAAA